ncbi:WYL domain-containing protein [Paraburkholderia caribensis]|uniref:WYL domain-containing protein n=1 Tax=Paraburkholderia caribensis TaxID=75105 RepID=UPI001CB052E1|nr:WYL domain-containing protein [Paraburkholderia caribensis]CAG9243839.1 WYL domain-containing protein [Paraburkholderia caribensis]
MGKDVRDKIRWGTERRLEFIEFRVYWEGGVNRSELVDKFGVSVPQASADLSLYQELAPVNLVYDSSQKRYVAGPEFAPRLLSPKAERYLSQVGAMADGELALRDTWISAEPDVDAMIIPQGKVSPEVLRNLLAAIRAGESVEIQYQSFNAARPDKLWRRITPLAFGFNGVRWHVRAFCHLSEGFKDFVLSRCTDVREKGLPGAAGSDDIYWHRRFDVVLIPHPELSASQRDTVAHDYGMPDGRLVLPVRMAMLFYLNKRMRFDMYEHDQTPAANQLVVENYAAFKAAIAEADAGSRKAG